MGLVDPDDLHNPRFAESVGPFFRKILDLRNGILDWNEIAAERPRLDSTLIDEMRAMYRDDVALLSKLVGRDLSHWMDPQHHSAANSSPQRGKELAFQS